jgi:LysR family transcriptional regulator, low CO2-responsive transcriptional regulator
VDNRVSLHKLQVFCLVVELGGAGRAAEHLFVSQPVVSSHIRSLEERLGNTLFNRTGQRLELTPAGQAVYAWARDVLRKSTELERELAGLADGTAGAAAVATSMTVGSYLLPPILTEFTSTHPGARIAAHVFDPNQIWEAITSGLCDLGVPIARRIPHGRGLTGELVGQQDLVLTGAPEAWPPNQPITVTDLAELPFISTPRTSIRRELEDTELAALGITERDVVIEFGHPEAIKHAVRAGLGVALLFRASVAAELASGSLREIPIEGARPQLPVFVVWRTDKHLTPLHQAVVTAIQHGLAPTLEGMD